MFVLFRYFSNHIDWQTRGSTAELTPLPELLNGGFLTQWVRKPARKNTIFDLVNTLEKNMLQALTVGIESAVRRQKAI